jgi:hypothetical protein
VVRRAARALAELHTSRLDTAGLTLRAGAEEAARAAKRARLLEHHVPELAPQVQRVAGALVHALAPLPTDTLRPGHGSYKASQLLVRDGEVFKDVMRRQGISHDELMAALRRGGLEHTADAHLVVLETTGQISVVERHTGSEPDAPIPNP